MLINGREKVGIKISKTPKAFTGFSQTVDDVYENLETLLTVLEDMIAAMESNKNIDPIVTELFLRGRKINISLIFVT